MSAEILTLNYNILYRALIVMGVHLCQREMSRAQEASIMPYMPVRRSA